MDNSIPSFEVINEHSSSGSSETTSFLSGFVHCTNSVLQNAEHCSSDTSGQSSVVEPDVSPKEMCEKLNDILKQNAFLKEKLQVSNSVLQEQLSMTKMWQEKIVELKKKHQESLKEIEEEKKTLKQENEKFQKEISVMQEGAFECLQCSMLKDKIKNLEKELENSSNVAKMKLSEELLKQRASVDELKRSMENVCCEINSLRSCNKLLEDEKRELVALNNNISLQLSKVNDQGDKDSEAAVIIDDDESDYSIIIPAECSLQKQADESCAWTDTLLALHELQSKHNEVLHNLTEEKLKSASLEKLLDEKKEQIEILKQVLENADRQEKQNVQLRLEFESIQKKLLAAEGQLEVCQNRCKVHCEELESFKDKVNTLQTNDLIIVEGLQTEIRRLQDTLDTATTNNEADRNRIIELQQELQILKEENVKMEETLSDFKVLNERLMSEIAVANQQHQEELDNLTAKLLDAEQNLEAEREKVSKGHDNRSSDSSVNGGISSAKEKAQNEQHKNREDAKTNKGKFRCPHCYMTFCSTLEEFANHVECECDLHYV